MRGFYEVKVLGDEKTWNDEQQDGWDGCCEDPYGDDEEENEREWCD